MITADQECLLQRWQSLALTTPSDTDDLNEERRIWQGRAATLIDWLLHERKPTT